MPLENLKQKRQQYGLKAYLKRTAAKEWNRLRYSIDTHAMVKAFGDVGLTKGSIVCAHSSLSRLGYVHGGGAAVIDALVDVVGPQGCLLMPAFSMTGSMASHVESGEVFDADRTPSRVGAITELFRTRPGVVRSLHPTNSLAAWGKGAEEFLRDHEKSPTPYGFETPYGRLAERDDTFILMMETHIHSLLHHLQERVNFPNLFLPDAATASFLDAQGAVQHLQTKLMRPHVPYFIAVPSASGDKPDWIVLHDFALMFPGRRPKEIEDLGYRFDGYPKAYQRRAEFEAAGILRTRKLGRGEIGLLNIRGFLARVEPELRQLIETYRHHYDPELASTLQYY